MNERRIDVDEALNALEHMDDFARMADIDPIGPRNVLLTFIEQVRNDRAAKGAGDVLDVDALANEIRRVDGNNSLGAGALAEALMPFLQAHSATKGKEMDDWRIDHSAGRPILVYQNCSVIEAEQAEYVLRLIEADHIRVAERTEWNTAWLTRNEGETK